MKSTSSSNVNFEDTRIPFFEEVSHQFQNFQQLDSKEKYAFLMVQEDVQTTEKLCCWIKNATEKRKTFLGIL